MSKFNAKKQKNSGGKAETRVKRLGPGKTRGKERTQGVMCSDLALTGV